MKLLYNVTTETYSSLRALQAVYPNVSFANPVTQESLDNLEITDFELKEPPESPPEPVFVEDPRDKRNMLLLESDWSQLPDSPVDASVWATYRQELRDLPTQEGFPDTIVWPVKPGG